MNPLILAAMPEEESALLQEWGGPESFVKTTLNARLGVGYLEPRETANGHRFLIARTGVGPVNAAVAAALICEARPEIDALVLLGVGGALDPELRIGELVIASSVLQHDSFSSLDFGHPRMRAGSFILNAEDASSHLAALPADEGLRALLAGAFPQARQGGVLSGNEFVGTVARKREIATLHAEALLVEMEAAGIAQVASKLGIPFAVAKTVADRLTPDGSIESDYRTCLHAAAENAARVLRVFD
jgi:5'-methylthioadenosine/S-adenosylhomocysteine nucleosidase